MLVLIVPHLLNLLTHNPNLSSVDVLQGMGAAVRTRISA
jgi:hypothetical protein